MTPGALSFLIRLEADRDYAGTVTSVQTGEHADFHGLADLARILERWASGDAATTKERP